MCCDEPLELGVVSRGALNENIEDRELEVSAIEDKRARQRSRVERRDSVAQTLINRSTAENGGR